MEIKTNAPTISSSALLVEHTQSVWTGNRMDKKASKEVVTANHAVAGAAHVYKKLLGNSVELKTLRDFAANARNAHYAMTLPWAAGLQLLPTANYFEYHEAMTGAQAEFRRLTDMFLGSYGWEVSQAQAKLGTLFNPMDYPSAEALRRKFSFNFYYSPVPEAGHFATDLMSEANDILKEEYGSYFDKNMERAMNSIWEKMHDVLGKLSERLDYGDTEDKKVFRDTLVSNALDVVGVLKSCNVTKDPKLEAMRIKLENTLQGVTAVGLRGSGNLREKTKSQVDAILKELPSLDF
jgi:hypothetical protein